MALTRCPINGQYLHLSPYGCILVTDLSFPNPQPHLTLTQRVPRLPTPENHPPQPPRPAPQRGRTDRHSNSHGLSANCVPRACNTGSNMTASLPSMIIDGKCSDCHQEAWLL